MAKYSRHQRLTTNKRQEIILLLCNCIKSINSDQDAAAFLADLLTPQELDMLAKRLLVAKRLLENHSYNQIRTELKVGFSTIGRIATWLFISGKGFRNALAKIPPSSKKPNIDYESQNIKRRFSQYYWPELLIEKIIKESDQKHKAKIYSILQSMKDNKKFIR